jgi:hypothetical protein
MTYPQRAAYLLFLQHHPLTIINQTKQQKNTRCRNPSMKNNQEINPVTRTREKDKNLKKNYVFIVSADNNFFSLFFLTAEVMLEDETIPVKQSNSVSNLNSSFSELNNQFISYFI